MSLLRGTNNAVPSHTADQLVSDDWQYPSVQGPYMDLQDLSSDDDQEEVVFDKIFKTCQALHRSSYPQSSINFATMDLSRRMKPLRKCIGGGGYSDVYKAALDDNTRVAVKVLKLITYKRIAEEEYKTTILRFFRELNYWHQLDHPNIARLMGFTLNNGQIGLVSVWYSNGNVVEYLQTHPKANKPDLILDVADGVEYLHTHSEPLVHADLKGVNVLVAKNGIACLADFGISKRVSDMNRQTGFTTGGVVAGTPRWMAPELLEGGLPSPASDVYSFAGVIIEICCPGRIPFHYIRNDAELMRAKTEGRPLDRAQYPEFHDKDVLWDLVAVCFSYKPMERPVITAMTQKLYDEFRLPHRIAPSGSRYPTVRQPLRGHLNKKPSTDRSYHPSLALLNGRAINIDNSQEMGTVRTSQPTLSSTSHSTFPEHGSKLPFGVKDIKPLDRPSAIRQPSDENLENSLLGNQRLHSEESNLAEGAPSPPSTTFTPLSELLEAKATISQETSSMDSKFPAFPTLMHADARPTSNSRRRRLVSYDAIDTEAFFQPFPTPNLLQSAFNGIPSPASEIPASSIHPEAGITQIYEDPPYKLRVTNEDEGGYIRTGTSLSLSKGVEKSISRSSIGSLSMGKTQNAISHRSCSAPSPPPSSKPDLLAHNAVLHEQSASKSALHLADICTPAGAWTTDPTSTDLSNFRDPDLLYPFTSHHPAQQNPTQEALSEARINKMPNESQLEPDASPIQSPQLSHSLLLESAQSAPIGSSLALGDAEDPPPAVTYPNDGRGGDQNVRLQWARWQSQEEPWWAEHKVLARAVALYGWNGVIPSRRTRGFPLWKGQSVDICNIINRSWYQVHHEGGCEYLPAEFVQIYEFADDAARELFKNCSPSTITIPQNIPLVPQPPKFKPSIWIRGSRRVSDPDGELTLPENEVKEQPAIPPAPFDREPFDYEMNQNRVVVSMKCSRFETGVIVTFHITLIPCPQGRFATFRFNAELPPGQIIIGIHPQESFGSSFTGWDSDARGQVVGTRRVARAAIVGGGMYSSRATWSGTEELIGEGLDEGGLGGRLELSILLPTAFLPSKLVCNFTGDVQYIVYTKKIDTWKTDRLQVQWEFNCT